MDRVRARMAELDIDVLLLSVGMEFPWMTGVHIDTRERLTMMVLPRDGQATLVAPLMEAQRIGARPDYFDLLPCPDGVDPVAKVVDQCMGARNFAIGDQTWTKFVLELQRHMPNANWTS